MSGELLEFTAAGSPGGVVQAIEQLATRHGSLSAIVVPWESNKVTLSMAVTSSRGDGWAVEHTNLGTIKLTDLGNDLTSVAIFEHVAEHAEKRKLTELFEGFARQVQKRFQISHD